MNNIAAYLAALLLLSIVCPAYATDVVAPMSFLNGHIEVLTDSPHNGVTATNSIHKQSQGYNVTQGDGLGGAVDGHFHDYDTVNGVTYVDLFKLEPRRGLASLVPEYKGDSPCGTVPNAAGVEVYGKCLDAVEGELNRAYDTLQPEASIASEVYALDGATQLAADQKFIVVLANADRSNDGILQIGCRTWPVVAYENMITSQLENGKTPSLLVDTVNGESLIFTLAGIYSDSTHTCPGEQEAKTKGLSTTPTLRIGFALGNQSILRGGIHATRAACVLGLHDYREKICYTDRATLTAAEAAVAAYEAGTLLPITYTRCSGIDPQSEPPLGYLRDPATNLHITALSSKEGTGFRWRNGALTVQLLKVNNSTNAAAYELQAASTLPNNKGTRFGGTVAKAFTVSGWTITADDTTKGPNQSGLLYEATMFWHYSALVDELRNADPASTPCYGDPNYASKVNIELGTGLTSVEYTALTRPVLDLIDQYTTLVCSIKNAKTEVDLKEAMLPLAELLYANPDLAQYHRYRDYAPGHVPESRLLDIDKGLTDEDYDGDGIVGICETDSDNDGLSNILEASIGTDPINTDTDGDGLSDYEEVAWDGDASSYNSLQDLNPLSGDTDGDGFKDGTEVAANYDPLLLTDFPVWGDINNDREVDAADVLIANRAVLGLVTLTTDQLARGNVAPLVNGAPDTPPDDEFTVADLLLITRKADHAVNY